MNFENLAKTWDSFGKHDPLWSILAWEGKKDNHWDPYEFFQVGEGEIHYIFQEAEKRKEFVSRTRSLDFGCGVGRLTLPLAGIFGESHGVDISESMIAHAKRFQAEKKIANCFFHLNRAPDLSIFQDESFDFILSLIALQHMEPNYFLSYLSEFLRTLNKGGVLVFQLPDAMEERANYEQFTQDTEPVMEMYGLAKEATTRFLVEKGGRVLDVTEDQSCGKDLKSYRYFVTK